MNLQAQHAEFRQQLLLADAQAQSAAGQIIFVIVSWWRLNDRLFMVRRGGHSVQ